jgi:hypothetical protein
MDAAPAQMIDEIHLLRNISMPTSMQEDNSSWVKHVSMKVRAIHIQLHEQIF